MMGDTTTIRPERITIAGSLEIPRIVNGLWQLAGGHDKDVDIAYASGFINTLYVSCLLSLVHVKSHGVRQG